MKAATKTGIVLVTAAVCAALLPRLIAGGPPPPREVRLVIRDMAFHLGDEPAANPVLRFRAGERVRLVVENRDPGMSHDFTVRAWRVATRLLDAPGHDVVELAVPDRPGRYEYACTPHSLLMRGAILVE